MVSAAEISGGTEYYGYAADNKRIYRLTSTGKEQMTFYGAQGEKLGVYTGHELDGDCAFYRVRRISGLRES